MLSDKGTFCPFSSSISKPLNENWNTPFWLEIQTEFPLTKLIFFKLSILIYGFQEAKLNLVIICPNTESLLGNIKYPDIQLRSYCWLILENVNEL